MNSPVNAGGLPGTAVASVPQWVRSRAVLRRPTDVEPLVDRYLNAPERSRYRSMSTSRRIPWLLGRVAAKRAVLRLDVLHGLDPLQPRCVTVHNDDHGRPIVEIDAELANGHPFDVSIAHKDTVAVALAATVPGPRMWRSEEPPWSGIGIDLETVDPRSRLFEATVLTPAERALQASPGDDRDTWLTRLWATKEATAKATGLGMAGRPRDFEVTTVDRSHLVCGGRSIATTSFLERGRHFVEAWTDLPGMELR